MTEHVVEEMRRRNVVPDQHTLLPVVSIYMQVGQTDDAVEALRVLSLRMLDGNNGDQNELPDSKTRRVREVLGYLGRRNPSLREETRAVLKDTLLHASRESLAVYTAALTGLVHGDDDEALLHKQSPWADRLSSQYDKRKIAQFAKSQRA